MAAENNTGITQVIGDFPYRMALAGGWIDQPFVSRHNPAPPGSMVVIGLEPTFRYMDRSGMATSTRQVAMQLWNGVLPARPPLELVRELYHAENSGKKDPSGSQDMAGLILPGINRLDYDFASDGGWFPAHIESCTDVETCRWLEKVIHVLPVAQRPNGYSPLDEINIDADWVRRLGQSGKDCFAAILRRDLEALGASMNECMLCWQALLPCTVKHPVITLDLEALLHHYQAHHAGAMYSGCGGGYLFVASHDPVPGAFRVNVRSGHKE